MILIHVIAVLLSCNLGKVKLNRAASNDDKQQYTELIIHRVNVIINIFNFHDRSAQFSDEAIFGNCLIKHRWLNIEGHVNTSRQTNKEHEVLVDPSEHSSLLTGEKCSRHMKSFVGTYVG